jgi:hypothetical protein
MNQKETKLYYGGLQTTGEHLRSCIYNIYVIGLFITPNFPRSTTMWIALKPYLDNLDTSEGRAWLKSQETFAHIIHTCIMDLQLIICRFAAVIAHDLDNRQRLTSENIIDAGPLAAALRNATQVANKVQFAISNASSEAYTAVPHTFALFFNKTKEPEKCKTLATPGTPQKPTKETRRSKTDSLSSDPK